MADEDGDGWELSLNRVSWWRFYYFDFFYRYDEDVDQFEDEEPLEDVDDLEVQITTLSVYGKCDFIVENYIFEKAYAMGLHGHGFI